MTYFITIAGRRWPVEETFKTGKDVLGWDQSQARSWAAINRHTALSALAQLRAAAIRNALCGAIQLPDTAPAPVTVTAGMTAQLPLTTTISATLTCASPSATRPSPPAAGCPARPASARSGCRSPRPPGSPCSPGSTPPGLITRARLAFALRWSLRRRLHQAIARWHHYSARLLTPAQG
jgi:hypothetical protein